MKAARDLAASARVAQDARVRVFVCAELPLVAMGTGLALGLKSALFPITAPGECLSARGWEQSALCPLTQGFGSHHLF